MLKEKTVLKINSKELIASLTTSIFIICYIIYPVWLVPGSFTISFLLLLVFIYASLVLFGIVFKVIPGYEVKVSRATLSKTFTIRSKKSIFFFGGVIIAYTAILLPSLLDVFTAKGDEGWHVNKIVFLANIYSFSGNIPFLLVWIAVILALIVLLFSIVLLSHLKLSRIWNYFKKKQELAILGIISFILFTLIGSFLLILYLDQYTNLADLYYREKLIRFGPIHPLTSLLIFLLFPWNDFALKSYSLVLMIISSLIIRQIFLDLNSENNNSGQVFALLSAILYLFFPVVMNYSTLVYLTAGVVLFYTLTTLMLIRFLKTANKLYLYSIFIFGGIGFLWKTVHLFCLVGTGLALIMHLVYQKRSRWKAIFIDYIQGGLISLIFIFPWLLLSMIPEFIVSENIQRFDPSILLTGAIFDYFSRANIEMGLIGIWCYFALIILFIWSVIKKRIDIMALFLVFVAWYLPFNMDTGWGHHVDRFMVPSLSVLAISFTLLMAKMIEILKVWWFQQRSLTIQNQIKKKNILKIGSGLLIIAVFAFASSVAINLQSGEPTKFTYLPIDALASYIAENMDSSDKVLMGFPGVTPVNFYTEKYNAKASSIYTVWAPFDEQNLTNFLDFLHSEDITYFVFTVWGNENYYSLSLIEELIHNPYLANEYQLVKQIGEGKEAIYIWKVL